MKTARIEIGSQVRVYAFFGSRMNRRMFMGEATVLRRDPLGYVVDLRGTGTYAGERIVTSRQIELIQPA